jgi:ferredoxin
MADRNIKNSNNVDGAFYTDKKCISCNACVGVAPDFFKMDYDNMHSYVKKQPKTPSDFAICNKALERCPVDAIGNDGYLDLIKGKYNVVYLSPNILNHDLLFNLNSSIK